jgi:flagellar assembly protein FliH
LYNKLFKNNQVTYGRPYQVKLPDNLLKFTDDPDGKADGIDEPLSEASPEELLRRAEKKAETIITEAKTEAQSIIEQTRARAEQEAEAIAEEAWQRGYAEGMEAAAAQNRSILEEAEKIKQNAAEEYEMILAGMEADILELAVRIARKAVAGELKTNRDVILQLVSSALAECSEKKGAVIRVSPEDYDHLNENMERLAQLSEGADELDIRPDGSMQPGDCTVETPLGSIDAGAETRLEKIEEALKEEYEGR